MIADMLSRRSAYMVTNKASDNFNIKTAFEFKSPYPISSVIIYRHLREALEKDPSLFKPINNIESAEMSPVSKGSADPLEPAGQLTLVSSG